MEPLKELRNGEGLGPAVDDAEQDIVDGFAPTAVEDSQDGIDDEKRDGGGKQE